MTLDEMIAVLQAAKAGKALQVSVKGADDWSPCFANADFNFEAFDFRVRREPRVVWINDNHVDAMYHHAHFSIESAESLALEGRKPRKFVEVIE